MTSHSICRCRHCLNRDCPLLTLRHQTETFANRLPVRWQTSKPCKTLALWQYDRSEGTSRRVFSGWPDHLVRFVIGKNKQAKHSTSRARTVEESDCAVASLASICEAPLCRVGLHKRRHLAIECRQCLVAMRFERAAPIAATSALSLSSPQSRQWGPH